MMKIISNSNIYILPIEKSNIIVIDSGKYKDELIECLNSYFVLRKKNKCHIFDENNDIMRMNDIGFIYFPRDMIITKNLIFKQKNDSNVLISKIIEENPENFKSIDKIRENLYGLLTDDGFYKLKKIISKGLKTNIDFDISEFSISSIISMLEIIEDCISEEEVRLILFNLLIFVSKENPILIYIDSPISDITENWLRYLPKNVYVLIENDSILFSSSNYNFLLLSNQDHLFVNEESSKNIDSLMYMFHPIIRSNIRFQSKENIELFNEYSNFNSTIFLKNTSYIVSK